MKGIPWIFCTNFSDGHRSEIQNILSISEKIDNTIHVSEVANLIWGYKMINIKNHEFTAPIVLEPKKAWIEMYGGKNVLCLENHRNVTWTSISSFDGACQESVDSFHLIKELLYSMIYLDFTTYPSTAQTYQIFWLHSKSLLLAPITEMSSISINNP